MKRGGGACACHRLPLCSDRSLRMAAGGKGRRVEGAVLGTPHLGACVCLRVHLSRPRGYQCVCLRERGGERDRDRERERERAAQRLPLAEERRNAGDWSDTRRAFTHTRPASTLRPLQSAVSLPLRLLSSASSWGKGSVGRESKRTSTCTESPKLLLSSRLISDTSDCRRCGTATRSVFAK